MSYLLMELEKLLSYGLEEHELTLPMLLSVCTGQAEDRIFDMMDAIGNGDREKALHYHKDLLELRQSGFAILALLCRHINILLQMEGLVGGGADAKTIASKVGIPPFTVGKYKNQLSRFTYEDLRHMLTACEETDYGIKSGRITEQIGIELLIIEFSSQARTA